MKSIFLFLIFFVLSFAGEAQAPIAYYPFTGNANDVIGINHGTVNGATLTTDRFGNANSAYSFDGVDDKITAPMATTTTSNFTLSGWVKLNAITTNQMLFFNGNSSLNGWGLYVTSTGSLQVLKGGVSLHSTGVTLITNKWYFLAVVNNGVTSKVYVNGAEVYSGNPAAFNTPTTSFFMSSNTINTEYVNGVLDDIKIYSTALTAAQILADYTPGLEVIASYSFSNNVSDSSGNNLHGTIIGSPSFVADRNGIPNKAIAFNGNVANRVEVNDNAFLHTSSISIAAWVKFNSLAGSHQGVVDKPLGTGFADSWHFGTQSGNWSTWIMNNTSTNPFSQLTSPITTGQWYFVVSTFDNATKEHRLYIDGTLKSSTTFNSTIGYDNSKMYFGAAIENNVLDYPMNGAIDEVKIYNTALTANQVFSEYSSLMASYPFAGNADDAIGTNHGTVNGATLTMDRFENPNSAYSFDGVNDFIQMSSPSYTAYTIEAYMRFDGPTADRNVVVFTQGNPFVSASHQIRTDASGHFVHYTFDGTGHAVVSNTIAQLNVDYHVTIVASNNGQMKLYINGIEEGTPINIGTLWNAGTEFRVGTGTVGIIGLNNANYFNGSIDDIKIYSTARTAAQILADYNPSANIIASYSFSNNVGDSSGNNLHGTIIGSPTFVADRNGISNKAIAFNGNASNRVEVNDTSLLHPASLSVAAWFKYNALGGIQTISHKTLGTGVADSWTLGTLNSSFSSWLFDNSSGATFNQVASDIVSNQWYYGVSTFDNVSKQHKLYIDGILRSTNTFNSSIGYDNSKMLIGAGIENNGPAFSMNGAVDELKIYNGALTPQQILNEYVTQTNFNTKGSGNAISFDGNDDYVQTPISLLNGATQFTMDFWVKTTENRTNGTFWQRPTLIGNANPSGPDGDFGIITNGGQIGVWSGTCSCGDQLLQTTTPINDNKWHHIAVTNNNVIMQIYVDGILLSGSIPSTGSGGIVTSARSLFIGASNSCCSGINAHAGTIDEVRFWNVALTETQVRERMCRKIKNDDALYSNLKAYYNFDENTGTTAFDGSINNQLVPLVNTPTRITSGAPIGNSSSFSYAGASSSLNHANPTHGDDVTATLTAGGANGIHVYHVNELPNAVAGIDGLPNNNSYFGTFVAGGSSPSLNIVYNYDGIPSIVDENALSLFSRNDNSMNSWLGELATLNTTANTLTKNGIPATQKEFIIGANDPGNISGNQNSCIAIVPNPLTGTFAFNNEIGIAYQWQDSIVGGVWQNISGATNATSLVLPLASSPKYYRRLATLGSLTLSSNIVLLDIRGAIAPNIFPNNQWNLYAYDGASVDSIGVTYKGSYSRTTLGINTIADYGSNNNPSAANGYQGCSITAPSNMYSLYAKRKGFTNGSYVINIPQHDDEIKIYVDGNLIVSAACCNNLGTQFYTLGTLDANSKIECRLFNIGGPGHLQLDLFTQSLTGGSIGSNQSNCGSFTPSILNNIHPAYGGSTTIINYQWQQSIDNLNFTDISGATSINYQPAIVTADKYFRRKAINANSEFAFSNSVLIDLTGPIFFADLDGDGFGDPNNTVTACTQPMGYLTDNSDCDDTDSVEHPGQVWYIDMDNDGYVSSNGNGLPALTVIQCTRPIGGKRFYELVTTIGRDCNDNDASINPMAQYVTISASPDFANTVFPLQGDPSTTFFFEAIYFDANNVLPSVTFPRAYLDFQSNFIINEPQDRIVVLNEFNVADQNTADGKKYVGSISGLPNGSTWQTFIVSEFSNACQQFIGPFQHPDVLLQPNVQIFANYIAFSDDSPPVSSPLTITAYVGNPSDFAVQNVVVHLKNQADTNAVYPDITIPYIASHTSGIATWNITTPSFIGLCPIQITVDYTNSINEPNELDNVAVASFNNGDAPVVGDIIVEAHVNPSTSYASANNILFLDFNAEFSNTNLPAGLKVAGALVTFQIVETGTTFTGFTGANGNINIPFTAPVGVGTYHISGTVSSPPFEGNINPNITTFALINGNAPDFTVSLGNTPFGLLEGQSTVKSIVVTNNGLAASADSAQLTVSIPGAIPSLFTFDVPPIAANSTYTISGVSIQFPSAGVYQLCAQMDAFQEIIELNENNNNSCQNITIATSTPDLEVISGSSGPQSICAPIVLSAMIRNTGGVGCAASTSRIIVKQGTTILQTFSHNVPTLAPAATYFYTESFTPAVPGVYTYSVESDQNQVIIEANETNNVNTYTINVTPCLPDFVVETCDLSSLSNTDYVSSNMSLNATITNVGVLATSTPLTVRFQFSDNTFVDVVHIPSIAIGQSVTVNTTVPAFVNTSITMKAIADPNNTIVEMNEANNQSFSKSTSWDLAFTSSVFGCGPDFTNFNHKPFFQYSLPVKIANYNLYVADTVKVKYEMAGPGLVGNVHLATVNAYQVISNCAACPIGVSLPSPFAFPQTGTYTLTLTIDPDNQYAESNELNNVWVEHIVVSNKPDMRVFTSYINPSLLNPALGQPVTVSVSYDNVGSSNVNDVMKMKLFIDNIAIDSVSNLSGLATNNYATVNFNVPWSSTIAGTHVIKAIIDSDNTIMEDEEDNNSATRALTVGSSANLYVDSLSVFNYYPNINDSANIKSIIKNEGDLPTNAFVSIYYVNNNLDSILIQSQSISLQGHDSVSVNTPWIVVDNKTKIVVIISNASALEYNYSDNAAFIELGKMALFTEAFPACDAGNTGTMIAHVIGGEPPYTYAWSNGAANQTIHALANSYSVTVFDATGQQVSGTDIIPPCSGVLVKVKCFLEGYFSFGTMESVLSRSGIISPLAYTDTVLVELHATTTGFPTTSSSKAILHNDGSIVCEFASSEIGSNRYIVLKHRNGIETWSANPMLISNNMVYDFTSAANKAYGSNQTEVESGVWAIFSGDVNQDENIDLDDFTLLEFDINNFSFGYFATDINGDGNVDLGDTPLVELNNNNFIYSNHPTP